MELGTVIAAKTDRPADTLRPELIRQLFQVVSAGELLTNGVPPGTPGVLPGHLDSFLQECSAALAHLRTPGQTSASLHTLQQTLGSLAERHRSILGAEEARPPSECLGVQHFLEQSGNLCTLTLSYAACLDGAAEPCGDSTLAEQDVLLIVDDEHANSELLARRLHREGHAVMTAESGSQALRMLSRYPVDLVLLDLQMPGLSGIETLKEIRKMQEFMQLPVIMVTAEDDINVIASCITSGADDYLIKPPQPILLRARVKALLNRKHLQDEQRRQRSELERASAALREQADQMERLLEHILPKSIATELQESGSVQPMYFEDVSIVFADIVGFTLSTENLPADDLVESLNEYFTACDEIVAKHGLEKMKTIGDSYMFAGGMPQHNSSHPIDSIFASLEMIEALKGISEARSLPWKLRVGLHVGPVIAGVVGIHKFAFDIWGEAVNAASRVEACGTADQVNLSSAAYLRVKDFFACEKRDQVRTKDGRTCDMYLVKGIAEGLRAKPLLTPAAAFQVRYAKYFRKQLASLPASLSQDEIPVTSTTKPSSP